MAGRETHSWIGVYSEFQRQGEGGWAQCKRCLFSPSCYFFVTNARSQGSFVKYIQQETNARVQIKGIGSGFVDQETGKEHDEPLFIHITYAI